MNKLTVFENEDFKIRTLTKNGEMYFIGKDVATMLGYTNTRDALFKHVEDEDKGVAKCDTLGGMQELIIINESGLYSLILSSKLKSAKMFKKWVTQEVLPSIRKNGLYAKEELLDNPDMLIQVATRLKEEKEKRMQLELEKEKLATKIEADKDKVLLAESIETNKYSIYIKDLAMILNKNGIDIGQNRLFKILREKGYLCNSIYNFNKPTQKALDLKIMEFKEHSIKTSAGFEKITFVPMITGKGQGYFIKKFLDLRNGEN